MSGLLGGSRLGAMLKTDFRLGLALNFNRHDWRDLMCGSDVSFISERAQLYIRGLAAAAYTGVFVFAWAVNILNNNAFGFLAFLTNWGLILGSAALWLLTYVTFVGNRTSYPTIHKTAAHVFVKSTDPTNHLPLVLQENRRLTTARICWAAQSVSLGIALIVSITYFIFLTKYNYPPIFTLAHVFNSAALLALFLISRIPFPFSHFILLYPVVILYVIATLLIYATNAVIDGQVGYVYPPLNFKLHPISAPLILALGALLCPIVAQLVILTVLGIKNNSLYYGEQPKTNYPV